jgi:thiamine-phosphate pyrophosphorylase
MHALTASSRDAALSITRRYSAPMRARQCLPKLWLISDARNDAALERALRKLPRGSGFIYRHYHLPPAERAARFERLARIAEARGHAIVVAGDGYGPATNLPRRPGMLRLATAHNLREIGGANRAGADAVLLSPVFPTRSHPDARPLGPARFRLLAAYAKVPVIALGGMTRHRAKALRWPRWAAIDGLS